MVDATRRSLTRPPRLPPPGRPSSQQATSRCRWRRTLRASSRRRSPNLRSTRRATTWKPTAWATCLSGALAPRSLQVRSSRVCRRSGQAGWELMTGRVFSDYLFHRSSGRANEGRYMKWGLRPDVCGPSTWQAVAVLTRNAAVAALVPLSLFTPTARDVASQGHAAAPCRPQALGPARL